MLSRIIGTRPCKGSIAAVFRLDRTCHTRLVNVLLFRLTKIGNESLLKIQLATQVLRLRAITRTRIIHALHRLLQIELNLIFHPKVFRPCLFPVTLPRPLDHHIRRNHPFLLNQPMEHTNSPTSTLSSPLLVRHQVACNSLPFNKALGNAVSANLAIRLPQTLHLQVQLPAINRNQSRAACVLTVCSVNVGLLDEVECSEAGVAGQDDGNDGVSDLYRGRSRGSDVRELSRIRRRWVYTGYTKMMHNRVG